MISTLSIQNILALVVFFAGSMTFAGGMEGGGGKSVVCRDSNGKVTSAELLDLYEGKAQYGLTYKESNLPATQQAMNILVSSNRASLPTSREKRIYDWYQNVVSHLRFIPENTTLNPIDDSLEVIAPKGCAIEQTVNYLNDQNILVSTEIWKALSETQKAALLIHESVYRYLRGYFEKDSRRARHFTAYLLSGGKVENNEPVDETIICANAGPNGNNTVFYLSKPYVGSDGTEKVKLQFYQILGRILLTKSFFEFNNTFLPGYPSFLEQLKHPRAKFPVAYDFQTVSPFEEGDQVHLSIGEGDSSIFMSGTSAVDGSQFGFGVKCAY